MHISSVPNRRGDRDTLDQILAVDEQKLNLRIILAALDVGLAIPLDIWIEFLDERGYLKLPNNYFTEGATLCGRPVRLTL